MSIKEDIEQAIHAHDAWKAKFRDFLSGKAAFDLATIGDAGACHLGQWIEQEGCRLLSKKDRDEICKRHTEFHRVARAIVQKIKQKDFNGARRDLACEGVFDQASLALAVALRKATLHASSSAAGPDTPPEPAASPAAHPPESAVTGRHR